jgi:hypothetical protein
MSVITGVIQRKAYAITFSIGMGDTAEQLYDLEVTTVTCPFQSKVSVVRASGSITFQDVSHDFDVSVTRR